MSRCTVELTNATRGLLVGIKNDLVVRLRDVRKRRGGDVLVLDNASFQVVNGNERSLAKASASAAAQGHSAGEPASSCVRWC